MFIIDAHLDLAWTALQGSRNHIVRSLATLLTHSRSGVRTQIVRCILQELDEANVRWQARDLPYRAALKVVHEESPNDHFQGCANW